MTKRCNAFTKFKFWNKPNTECGI